MADALEEAGVTLEDQDLVTPQPQTPLEQGTNIQVQRVETKTVEVAEEIPFETVEKATPLLAPGTVRVTRQGAPGERVCTYEETWVDGALQSREKTGEEVTLQPVAQTAMVGADVPVSSTPCLLYTSIDDYFFTLLSFCIGISHNSIRFYNMSG